MANYTSLKTRLIRALNLIWVYLFAVFTRRRIDVYLRDTKEAVPGEPLGCTYTWLWTAKYPGRRRRANTLSSVPQNSRSYSIMSGIQLAEELIKFTFRLPNTAAFIHLDERDTIPVIVHEAKIIPGKTNI